MTILTECKIMSNKESYNMAIATKNMNMPALQVQSSTLGTLVHFKYFRHLSERSTNMNKRRFTVLLTLCLFLTITGCGNKTVSEAEMRQQMFADMRLSLSSITEMDRREKVLALVDTIEEQLNTMKEIVAQFVADSRELNSNYDATRYEFNKLQAQFNGSRQALQQKIMDAKFELKELTTEEEWSDLAGIKNAMMLELSEKQ